MFGFHKPKMYRSLDGCCICRAKSSSSRFTDSKRYEKDFTSCFGLCETRTGEICNACVLLVKRWKKLPTGSKKNWNHVVDARGGPSLKLSSRPKKIKPLSKRAQPSQISRLQKELKRINSDAHSTTSSTSPAQSPSYSPSDEGSDAELSPGSSRSPVFSFLDLTYWKRQRVCCGIIYKGRFGEVLIDPHLFKPCCRNKQQEQQQQEAEEEEGYDEEDDEEEEVLEEQVEVEEEEVGGERLQVLEEVGGENLQVLEEGKEVGGENLQVLEKEVGGGNLQVLEEQIGEQRGEELQKSLFTQEPVTMATLHPIKQQW